VPWGPSSSVSTIDEVRRPGDLPLWEVPGWQERFGVTAGITGRGDDPAVPFDLGLSGSCAVGDVMGRWRRFRAGFPGFPGMVMARQVHGRCVLWHPGGTGWTIHDDADGQATNASGLLLLVTVADCVPVYLVAPAQRAVALLHAGWRGTAAGVLAEGLRILRQEAGIGPAELVMHLGVAISGPRYEVGEEVLHAVGEDLPGPGPWHLDLRELLARQGRQLGVGEISRSAHCTASSPGSFFSHRASGGTDGRMIAFLGIPSDSPAGLPSPMTDDR
jgi:YfiH family protein